MDISFKARSFGQRESVVLNVDVQFCPDTRTMSRFLAEVLEESPEVIDCHECGSFQATNKIFYCCGNREEEWETALALFDLLSGYGHAQGVRKPLASRVLELQTRSADSYSVRLKVYLQGHAPDNGKPIAWLTGRHSFGKRSSYVVPENEINALEEARNQAFASYLRYKDEPLRTH